jgi:hypothetical protein
MVEKQLQISVPELILVAVTRGAIGVGVGLLIANRLSRKRRKTLGLPLFVLGALSSIPIAIRIFHKEENALHYDQSNSSPGYSL